MLAELAEQQREMVLFALATGLRQGNITGLCWSHVDLECKTVLVAAEDAKGGEDLHVSLNDLAVGVLQSQQGKHPERVYGYKGRKISSANTTRAQARGSGNVTQNSWSQRVAGRIDLTTESQS